MPTGPCVPVTILTPARTIDPGELRICLFHPPIPPFHAPFPRIPPFRIQTRNSRTYWLIGVTWGGVGARTGTTSIKPAFILPLFSRSLFVLPCGRRVMPLFPSVKQYTSRLLQSLSISDDRVNMPRRMMNVQFGLWTSNLICVSPSADRCSCQCWRQHFCFCGY
jgi:hypothetical protein